MLVHIENVIQMNKCMNHFNKCTTSYTHKSRVDSHKQMIKQDNQALPKAKYCPRVAAASRTQKTPNIPCDLDP